jgi:hypothetical protein
VMGAENRIENVGEEGYRTLGRCFKTLFGIPLGPKALLTLRPCWLPEPHQGWLNWVRWQGSGSKTSAPHETS